MPRYGLPRRPIFWMLDPRTIGAASFKVCAPDNDCADLARSSLRERAESYAKSWQGRARKVR